MRPVQRRGSSATKEKKWLKKWLRENVEHVAQRNVTQKECNCKTSWLRKNAAESWVKMPPRRDRAITCL